MKHKVRRSRFGLLLAFATLLLQVAWSQRPVHFACYYGDNKLGDSICTDLQAFSLKDNEEAMGILQRILAPVGLRPNFVLEPCSGIKNCVATTGEDGLRYIVYDPVFMKGLTDRTHDNWASLSIFAHEVLHHLNQHTHIRASLEKRREMELEADEWSGRILALLGASLKEAQSAMELIQHPVDETFSSHPSKERRLEAIERGYDAAKVNPPKPKEQLQLKDLSLQYHEIVKLDSLTQLKGYRAKGMSVSQLLFLDGHWVGFLLNDGDPMEQEVLQVPHFSDLSFKTLGAHGQYIHSLDAAPDGWVAIMEVAKAEREQSVVQMTDLDLNELNLKKAGGQVVKDITKGEGKWVVVFENAEANGCLDQLVMRNKTFPYEDINQYWGKRYLVTTAKFIQGEWIIILQRFDVNRPIVVQAKGKKSTFPFDELMRFEAKDFRLDIAGYDGTDWYYILNRKK